MHGRKFEKFFKVFFKIKNSRKSEKNCESFIKKTGLKEQSISFGRLAALSLLSNSSTPPLPPSLSLFPLSLFSHCSQHGRRVALQRQQQHLSVRSSHFM
jgi:hypothetical protein